MNLFYQKLVPALQYANLLCTLLLAALLPFPYEYRKAAGIAFFVSFFLEYAVSCRWRSIKIRRAQWYFIAMLFFFLLIIIYLPFEKDFQLWHRLLDYRLWMAGFGVVGFLGLSPKVKMRYVLNAFIVSAVAITCYLIFCRIGFTAWRQNFEVLDNVRWQYVGPHPLFNFCFNLALVGIWYALYFNWRRMRIWVKLLYFAAALPVYYMLLTSIGRTGVFTTLVITSLFAIINLWKYRRWLGIVALAAAPFFIYGGIMLHTRIDSASGDPRLFLWKISIPLIKDNPILGYGAANAQSALDSIRKNHPNNPTWIWSESDFVDAHNQYLITALEFGALGLIILLFLYLSPFFMAEPKLRPLLIILIAMVLIESCTDSVMHRLDLGAVFGLLMAVVFAQNSKNNKY